VLFAVEVGIATALGQTTWVRGFVGDVLATLLVYYAIKTVVQAPAWKLAIASLLVGYLLEAGQYLAREKHWVIHNRLLRIVIGSTPDWWDVLAYTVGFALALTIEGAAQHRKARAS
jgi:Protein of unknown function (DUF2809)